MRLLAPHGSAAALRGARCPRPALLLALCAASCEIGHFSAAEAVKASLLPPELAPLHTQGRYIVRRDGERLKWACVNWYGAHSEKHVVGGLERRNISEIVARVVDIGFNCVRLVYSTQGHVQNPVIADEDVAGNPEFRGGLRFLDVFDRTVEEITSQGLMVIINNHNHKSGWCCHYSQDEGLWYTDEYPESTWIWSLVDMTERYKHNQMVVGIDLRNEVHDYKDTQLTWGDGDLKTDWAAAATRAGNAVLSANSDVLVVVMALCFGMELRPAREHPVKLAVSNRVVYESHSYLEYQIWQLISQNFESWGSIGSITGFCTIFLMLTTAAMWKVWRAVDHPWPRWGTIFVVAGAWWFLLLMAAFAVASGLYGVCTRYCSYAANRDIQPVYVAAVAAAQAGLVAIAVGCIIEYRFWKSSGAARTIDRRDDAPWSCQSAASPTRDEPECEVAYACEAPEAAIHSSPVASDGEVPMDQEGHRHRDFHGGGAAADISMEATGTTSSRDPPYRRSSLSSSSSSSVSRTAARQAVRSRAFCARGWRSWKVARARLMCNRYRKVADDAIASEPVEWDSGLCCGLQFFILCLVLLVSSASLHMFAAIAPSYWLVERHFDRNWGFVLEDGQDYTAPVWMGEFGNAKRGEYWVNLMRYLSDRDVDFAYWALNGRKWLTAKVNAQGDWVEYDEPKWSSESYGILAPDYWHIRSAWRLLDLQLLMESSGATWGSGVQPCDREVLGPECGG